MITKQLKLLTQQQPLSPEDMLAALEAIFANSNPVQASAFLALLSAKGINSNELTVVIKHLQTHMQSIAINSDALDIVGTGGDGMNTINISTPAAILAASLGVKVVKHGNRSSSSLCGSTDLLERLGYNIQHHGEQVAAMFAQTGFGYCYAVNFHPQLAKVKTLRQQLGIASIFNLTGPLLNPAQCPFIMLGVYDAKLMPLFAKTLKALHCRRALVFHSSGTDELTTCAPAETLLVEGDEINSLTINPTNYGLNAANMSELSGGNPDYNAQAVLDAFAGKRSAFAETLALNAGVGMWLSEHCDTIATGIDAAMTALQQQTAQHYLQQLIETSHHV